VTCQTPGLCLPGMLNNMEKIEACRTSEYYKTGEKGKPFIIII